MARTIEIPHLYPPGTGLIVYLSGRLALVTAPPCLKWLGQGRETPDATNLNMGGDTSIRICVQLASDSVGTGS